MNKFINFSLGIVLCIVIGIIGLFLSKYLPIGAITISIILGIIVGNLIKIREVFEKGIFFSEKYILAFAIALMGVNLNFLILKELGFKTVLLIIFAMILTIFSSITFAKVLKFDQKFALIIGIGNGICGSSAIAATKEIVGLSKEKVGISIAVVNFLGTIGIFLIPFLNAIILNFFDINIGFLIGNTLQAVGHVVASGFSVSEAAGQTATIVKMVRVLMLTPVILTLLYVFRKKHIEQKNEKEIKKNGIPIFIIGFILFSLIPSLNLLSENYIHIISKISKYALIIAMAGIGLKIKFSSILRDGKSALLIGVLIFLFQIVFSTTMIQLFLND